MMERTHYEVLGVDRSADDRSIRRAYMKASLLHHPDKNPGDEAGAQSRFVEVGRAYEVLKDPLARAGYDRKLDLGTWRTRRREGGGGANGGLGTSKGFQNYSDAFESFMADMSEEELSAAMGAAAAVGSVVGSILGSRLARSAASGSGSSSTTARGLRGVVGSAASLAGSAAASQFAADLVKSAHERSVERVTYEERRRAAVQRGEDPPEPPRSVLGGIRDSIGRTAEAARGVPSSNGDCGDKSGGRRSSGGSDKWQSALGVAMNVAGAVAAMNEAKSGKGSR
mmetsp:Transcript_31312/g.93791  ORF Transcript_31312/g.93791 Transcript_31312/m.93791 type:complete len:283 (-) Transcript_31312:476-1324(-)